MPSHVDAPGIAVAPLPGMTAAATYFRRLVGALALDPDTYEGIEADPGATSAALATVVLSSTATGIGMASVGGPGSVAALIVFALLAWGLWALLVFGIAARLSPTILTRADVGQLLRTVCFASAPGVFNVLGVAPPLRLPVLIVTQIWIVLAVVVAVRQALDYTRTTKAVALCVIAGALAIALVLAAGFFLGGAVG